MEGGVLTCVIDLIVNKLKCYCVKERCSQNLFFTPLGNLIESPEEKQNNVYHR